MHYPKEKQMAIRAVKAAGQVAQQYFKHVDHLKLRKKSHHELVSPADIASNVIIKKYIHQNFPQHGIFSEETGKEHLNREYFWVIDPIDGTTNFALGNPFFNISLALVHRSEIVLGVVYAPMLKQLFVAEKGKGAYLNDKKIHVSDKNTIADSIVNFGYSYRNNINKKFSHIYINLMMGLEHTRNLGAAALEFAWVAMGRLEGYVLFDVKLWDMAAGVLLVQEAGGQVTDFQNQPFTIKSKTILATNGKVHRRTLHIIDKKRF